jgi:phosphoglycerate dehydrogenase-like enzyme/glyoxylase-like metal-dependent hydrolase (beta-lactamase superfamily II)
MQPTPRLALSLAALLTTIGPLTAQQPPKMEFNEVRQVAPGVFFRYSVISATDMSKFGGCNNIWVEFQDYVLAFDANFPKEAGDAIAAIRKTTKKPIRYVIDSHHHGDHAYGNAVWAEAGASVVGQLNCFRWLKLRGPQEFAEAGSGKTGRKDIAASKLKVPDIVFDDKLVFDDGTQRAEVLFLGHCHTPGDAFLFLPKQKILCTGDACVNGAFNYTGHSDTAAWIKNLEKAQQLDIQLILPGHGPPATKELLVKQRRYFVELRQQVKKGIEAGKDVEDIGKSITMPWYKEWTGVAASTREENVQHVYNELTGRTLAWDLFDDFSIYEAIAPPQKRKDWEKPKRIVIPDLMPDKLAELKKIAPTVFFVPVGSAKEAAKETAEADAVIGFAAPKVGKKLRWVQVGAKGMDRGALTQLHKNKVVVTDVRHINGSDVADQAFALLLALTRNLTSPPVGKKADPRGPVHELKGKSLLVVGLGSIGRAIARRANAFGMRVLAIDAEATKARPDYVFTLQTPGKLMDLLPQADVVILAGGQSANGSALIGVDQLRAMKRNALLINVARGGLVDAKALAAALQSHQLGGAGLDGTDPEPKSATSSLRKLPNVIITEHQGGTSPEARAQQWRLLRENVRRFVNGERLLCIVEER